jgi:hypothetical protein
MYGRRYRYAPMLNPIHQWHLAVLSKIPVGDFGQYAKSRELLSTTNCNADECSISFRIR